MALLFQWRVISRFATPDCRFAREQQAPSTKQAPAAAGLERLRGQWEQPGQDHIELLRPAQRGGSTPRKWLWRLRTERTTSSPIARRTADEPAEHLGLAASAGDYTAYGQAQ